MQNSPRPSARRHGARARASALSWPRAAQRAAGAAIVAAGIAHVLIATLHALG